MEKIYEYENATIVVTLSESCDQEKLRRVTEDFLKKAICGGKNNGNTNKTRNLYKK